MITRSDHYYSRYISRCFDLSQYSHCHMAHLEVVIRHKALRRER